MRNYINSPLDLRTRCYFSGGGGNSNKVNKRRENKGVELANEALRMQQENARRLEALAQKAAEEAWNRTIKAGETYEANQLQYGDKYLSDTEGALATYDSGLSEVFDYLRGAIDDYAERSDGIATRSADEAWDWNRGKLDEFASFANALSEAAFNTRQQMIADTNPYQIAQQQQAGKNNLDMLSGRLPADVMAAQQRVAAQQAIQGGFGGGSAMGMANSARNLGLTSLDLMQYADQSSRDWARSIYDTQINGLQVTPGSVYDNMGLKTEQVLAVNQQNNLGIMTAQQDLGNKQLTGLNNALGARTQAYRDIYSGNSQMAANVYSGTSSGAYRTAGIKAAGYSDAANLTGRAISDWNNTRQTINNTAWQNQLQGIADANRNRANMITGLTTAAGALAGSFIGPVGTAGGAAIGAGLGGAIAGGDGSGGPGYASAASPGSAWASGQGTSNAWGSLTGLTSMITGGLDRNSGFYGSATGAANAFNVAPSEISRWGVGQYYYTPAGRYGFGSQSYSNV